MSLNAFIKDNVRIIAEIKKRYSNLFAADTVDGFFIFRPMTKGEFSNLSSYSLLGETEVEDEIFKKYVLYSNIDISDLSSLHAGTPTVISRHIIAISGFGDEELFISMLNKSRDSMSTAENQIVEIIIKAFPYFTLEDIENLDIQQLSYRLALAEKILGVSLTFTQPEQKSKKPNIPVDFEKENLAIMGKNVKDAEPFAW